MEPDQCSEDVIAYYKFDRSFRDVCFGRNAQEVKKEGSNLQLLQSSGILNGAAGFFELAKLRVPDLNGYAWGSKFSLSLWFKTGSSEKSQGLISNGPVNDEATNSGSWEIQMVRQYYSPYYRDYSVSASVLTSHSSKTWTNITTAISDHWHHLVMTYDGKTINFYHNNHLKLTDSCMATSSAEITTL